MTQLVWSDRALEDLQEIRRYWVVRDPFLIIDLDRELSAVFGFLLENPRAGSLVSASKRRKWRIGRTPFLLFYTISGDDLRIGRIRHEHQNWRRSH